MINIMIINMLVNNFVNLKKSSSHLILTAIYSYFFNSKGNPKFYDMFCIFFAKCHYYNKLPGLIIAKKRYRSWAQQ